MKVQDLVKKFFTTKGTEKAQTAKAFIANRTLYVSPDSMRETRSETGAYRARINTQLAAGTKAFCPVACFMDDETCLWWGVENRQSWGIELRSSTEYSRKALRQAFRDVASCDGDAITSRGTDLYTFDRAHMLYNVSPRKPIPHHVLVRDYFIANRMFEFSDILPPSKERVRTVEEALAYEAVVEAAARKILLNSYHFALVDWCHAMVSLRNKTREHIIGLRNALPFEEIDSFRDTLLADLDSSSNDPVSVSSKLSNFLSKCDDLFTKSGTVFRTNIATATNPAVFYFPTSGTHSLDGSAESFLERKPDNTRLRHNRFGMRLKFRGSADAVDATERFAAAQKSLHKIFQYVGVDIDPLYGIEFTTENVESLSLFREDVVTRIKQGKMISELLGPDECNALAAAHPCIADTIHSGQSTFFTFAKW